MIWFTIGIIAGGAAALLGAHDHGRGMYVKGFLRGKADGHTVGYIEGLQDHAEMLKVLREVYEASEYWSDYDVPITMKDDIKRVVDKVLENAGGE